jgi:hypothetical protein
MKGTGLIAVAILGAFLASPALSADNVLFVAGTTTLPEGSYQIVNKAKGVEYRVTVDNQGKMLVHDVINAAGGAAPAAPAATAPAAAAATAAAAPVTGATAVATPPAGAASAAGAAAPHPNMATQLINQHGKDIESLVKKEVGKQLLKQGGDLSKYTNKLKGL